MAPRERLAVGLLAAAGLGCALPAHPAAAPAVPSYARTVLPVLARSCAGCHRPGGLGGHHLTLFDAAGKPDAAGIAARSRALVAAVKAGRMPMGKPGSVSAEEIAMLEAWVQAGSPVDDPAAGAPGLQPPAGVPLPGGLTRLPAPAMAPPTGRTTPATVQVALETREVTALLADGVGTTCWTFGGTVPGPMVRVRQGDTVQVKLRNGSGAGTHSIDFHAATGPGGGGVTTQIPAGATAEFAFQALAPGAYVYHCASPKVAAHVANGMYGLIVVEPPEGLPRVDREFYLMQGEVYLEGERGTPGMRAFSWERLLAEQPEYVVMNGAAGAVAGDRAFKAAVGETVRFYFGVGGPNLASSFHMVGEIFDRVWPEGAGEVRTHVQTTLVPPGGATIADVALDVPGTYTLVDHALGRLDKGCAALLEVAGEAHPGVFQAGPRLDGHGQPLPAPAGGGGH